MTRVTLENIGVTGGDLRELPFQVAAVDQSLVHFIPTAAVVKAHPQACATEEEARFGARPSNGQRSLQLFRECLRRSVRIDCRVKPRVSHILIHFPQTSHRAIITLS